MLPSGGTAELAKKPPEVVLISGAHYTLLSNCTLDRGTLYPAYKKPFDILAEGLQSEDWRGGRDSNSRPLA